MSCSVIWVEESRRLVLLVVCDLVSVLVFPRFSIWTHRRVANFTLFRHEADGIPKAAKSSSINSRDREELSALPYAPRCTEVYD